MDNLHSYTPILDALANCQLREIKRLKPPTSKLEKMEVINYVTCALFMKDRLESILISDDFKFTEGASCEKLYYNRLYDKLDRFSQLTEIKIKRTTNEQIQELDHIVQSCKHLKKINFDFQPHINTLSFNNNIVTNKNIAIDAIQNFTPRPDIKTLVNKTNGLHDNKALLYMIRKFPQLDHLVLNYSKEAHSSYKLTQQTLTQILYYLSTIDKFDVSGFKLDQDNIIKGIGSYWAATANLGSTAVKFLYSGSYSREIVDLSNSTFSQNLNDPKNYIEITHSLLDSNCKHTDFIKENGPK